MIAPDAADDPPDKHRKRIENPNARCPRHPDKDYRPLVEAAWKAGWWCERNKKNYILCMPPGDGKAVVVPSTPNKHGNRLRNLRAQFRLRGLAV